MDAPCDANRRQRVVGDRGAAVSRRRAAFSRRPFFRASRQVLGVPLAGVVPHVASASGFFGVTFLGVLRLSRCRRPSGAAVFSADPSWRCLGPRVLRVVLGSRPLRAARLLRLLREPVVRRLDGRTRPRASSGARTWQSAPRHSGGRGAQRCEWSPERLPRRPYGGSRAVCAAHGAQRGSEAQIAPKFCSTNGSLLNNLAVDIHDSCASRP